jgi:predicted ABC-type ATPase
MNKPRIVILAGPNGARKTTESKYLLPEVFEIEEFVYAGQIAAGLSGFAPESIAFEAERIMLRRTKGLVEQKKSFAFETTLSSNTIVKLVATTFRMELSSVVSAVAL